MSSIHVIISGDGIKGHGSPYPGGYEPAAVQFPAVWCDSGGWGGPITSSPCCIGQCQPNVCYCAAERYRRWVWTLVRTQHRWVSIICKFVRHKTVWWKGPIQMSEIYFVGRGHTGFTLYVSTSTSVCRRHGFRSAIQICLGIYIKNSRAYWLGP